jgi:hypothetical protein
MMMHQPIRPAEAGAGHAYYIVYLLDGDGRIRGSEWIAAPCDADAIAAARAIDHPFGCELWQRDRKIALDPL